MLITGRGVKLELSLRSPIYAIFLSTIAIPVWADGHLSAPKSVSEEASAQFELGGSVERAARAPAPVSATPSPRASLSLPLSATNTSRREANVLGLMLFSDEGWDDGRDAFLLGTAYTQGAATAGVSVTYLDEGAELARSELYVDYALSQNFSIGLAGILDNDFTDQDTPIPQLGVNAAFSTEGGAFFEGGISDAESSQPVFGLSIGLRF